MRHFAVIIALALLFSCSQAKFMNYDDYYNVQIGESIAQIQVEMGRPYEVKELLQNKQEYIYIERIPIGDGRDLFRRYIFIVQDGKVIEKRVVEQKTPAFRLYN